MDNNGVKTAELLNTSGTKSGIISTTAPNGRVQVIFTSDVSVCYASNPSVYSGINVSFAVNTNNIVNNALQVTGNGYVNGNLGVGTLSPREKIDVLGNGIITGKLGIGVTDPQGALHVRGTYDNSWIYFSSNAGMNSTKYKPKVGNGLAFTWNYSGNDEESIINYTGSSNARLDFTSWDGTNLATEMTLKKGRLGIGTITPRAALEVFGNNATPKIALRFTGADKAATNYIQSDTDGHYLEYGTFGTAYSGTLFGQSLAGSTSILMAPKTTGYGFIGTTTSTSLIIGTNNIERMRITPEGKVGIGISNITTDALLTVNGIIHASEVRVNLEGLADYVFKPSYNLMPLSQVEQFVKTNSHLPEIPSAAEVSKNGMNMGEMQNKLLQKIEELTLYMIDMQKTINIQSSQIEELKKIQK
ncbi:MAG: hypothetical protein GZ091_17630 [Paludibacter sp.]|nr:hypothetical protein [Paludibacter sp.]